MTYDRRQKRAAQQKWCTLVSHIAQESLPVNQTRRKLTVFLSAPPGDGLGISRTYFQEYVKPVLVAAALDYEVVEGRKEGDVRAAFAEKLREARRSNGELGAAPADPEEDPSAEELVLATRRKLGTVEEPVTKGDLIVGRHTWKEYVRGLHEGWLGPMDVPAPPQSEPSLDTAAAITSPVDTSTVPEIATPSITPVDISQQDAISDGATPTSASEEQQASPEEPPQAEDPPKPTGPKAPYLATTAYSSSQLSPCTPTILGPSTVIPHPHILGFLNTPIRIYRFLNQRHLADNVGRETAALVLAMSRSFDTATSSSDFVSSSTGNLDASPTSTSQSSDGIIELTNPTTYEQVVLLTNEEPEWHKSVRKTRDPDKESVWLDPILMDARIAEKMQRFEISPEEEERAKRIAEGKEGAAHEPLLVPKTILGGVGDWGKGWLRYVGVMKQEEDESKRIVLGNLNDEDA